MYFILNGVTFLELHGSPQGGPGSLGSGMVVIFFMNTSLDVASSKSLVFCVLDMKGALKNTFKFMEGSTKR